MRTSRRWSRTISGVAASLTIHGLLAIGLVLAIKIQSPPVNAPAIVVQLVTLLAPQPAPVQAPRNKAKRPAGKPPKPEPAPPSAPAVAPPSLPPPPETIPIPAPPAAPPPAPGAPPDANMAGLRNALRGIVGCADRDALHLTSAERAACDRKAYAGGNDAAPLPLNIDPEKTARWAADQERERELDRKPFVACEGPGSNLGMSCPAH